MRGKINGVSVEEVFCKLLEDIPGVISLVDKTNYPYIEYAVLRPYFEKHIPQKNYDFICGDVTVKLIGDEGEGFVSCAGTITVKDDEGEEICRKSGVGAANLEYNRKTGKLVDPTTAVRSAVANCRKSCMIAFGCGERQLDAAKLKNKRGRDKAPDNQNGSFAMSGTVPQKKEATDPSGAIPYGAGVFVVRKRDGELKTGSVFNLVPVEFLNGTKTYVMVVKSRFSNAGAITDRICAGDYLKIKGTYEEYGKGDRIIFDCFMQQGA